MKNAHLRFGFVNYRQNTRSISTNIRVRVDRYMGLRDQGHLLSIFGGDTEVGAISAAIAEQYTLTINYPDGSAHTFNMGEQASCYRGAITVPGRKHPLRHLVAVSRFIQTNGSAGRTYLLNFRPDLAWNLLVSVMGIPARPAWGEWMMDLLVAEKRIEPIEGIGCDPVVISATRKELLDWVASGVKDERLRFPDTNGPIAWPALTIRNALAVSEDDLAVAA